MLSFKLVGAIDNKNYKDSDRDIKETKDYFCTQEKWASKQMTKRKEKEDKLATTIEKMIGNHP